MGGSGCVGEVQGPQGAGDEQSPAGALPKFVSGRNGISFQVLPGESRAQSWPLRIPSVPAVTLEASTQDPREPQECPPSLDATIATKQHQTSFTPGSYFSLGRYQPAPPALGAVTKVDQEGPSHEQLPCSISDSSARSLGR